KTSMRAKPIPVIVVCLLSLSVFLAQTPRPPSPGDWPMYSRDLSGTRYSPLTQITTKNVAKLTSAWTFRLRFDGGAAGGSEVTPIVIDGVMYLSAGSSVCGLNPDTGTEIWRYDVQGGSASSRGVTYWPGDGKLPPRIFFTA